LIVPYGFFEKIQVNESRGDDKRVKTYPVILYPKVIIQFLAENPTPTLNSYQQKKSINQVFPPAKSQVRVVSFKDDKWRWLLLKVISFKNGKWRWLLLFIAGILAIVSWTFLSPTWLIAIAWSLIFIGVTYYLSVFGKAAKKSNKARKTSLNYANNKKKTGIILRCQERELQLLSLLTNSVLKSSGISNVQQGVSEKTFTKCYSEFSPRSYKGWNLKIPITILIRLISLCYMRAVYPSTLR